MKNKVFRFLALCLFGAYLMPIHAEDKNILIVSDNAPDSRSIVQLPTAILHNGSIEFSFPYACTSVITITEVVNESNVITETSTTPKDTVTLDVSNLKAGKTYCIIIYAEGIEYYGYFEL